MDQGIKEGIDVTLDRPRKLRLDFAALATVARRFPDTPDGRQLVARLVRVEGDGDSRMIFVGDLWALHVLTWASLLHEEPTLTMEHAGQLIDDYRRTSPGALADLALAVWASWQVGGLNTAKDATLPNAEAETTAASVQ